MSVSLEEVINAGGYDLNKINDIRWFLGKKEEIEDLLEECENKLEKYDEETFNDRNCHYEDDHLVYDGSLEELADELGVDYDELYDKFSEYEDDLKEQSDYIQEINEAKKGEY